MYVYTSLCFHFLKLGTLFLFPRFVFGVPVADQDKQDMEKQIWELRAKLSHSAVMSEIEELKRCNERKDKEKAQLAMKIEVTLFHIMTLYLK